MDHNIQHLVSQLSSHNDAISKASKESIPQLLPVAVKNLESVASDIGRAWALVQRLEKRKQDAIEFRWQLKTPYLREFPPEILGEIFTHALSDEAVALPSQLQRFGDVCREWRIVGLTTPALWDNVSITYSKKFKGEGSTSKWMKQIRECISRSEGLPLTLNISSGGSKYFHPITEFVVPLGYRLRCLHISTTISNIIQFLTLPSGSFNVLKEITISQPHLGSVAPEHRLGVLSTTLNLRKVSIKNFCAPHRILLPWARITHITIEGITPNDYYAILRLCSATIAECRFTDILSPTSRRPGPPLSLLVCQRMKVLHLDFFNRTTVLADSLLHLSLPSLNEIKVTTMFMSREIQPKTIADLISRSGCTLTIMDIDIEANEDILRLTPSLLKLATASLAKPTLQMIGLGHLVPNLRVLKFAVKQLAPVIDMLNRRWSRRESEPGIYSVLLDCSRLADAEKARMRSLKLLISQGTGITIMSVVF